MEDVPQAGVPAVRRSHRLGWLLRVNRLFGAEYRYVRLRCFSKEFARGGTAQPASVGTFSRWETGVTAVTHGTVRRYEQVLGLPAGSLVSVIDTVSRYLSASPDPAPLLVRPDIAEPERRIEELVDRARSGDLMTAQDWDELTNLLARNPGVLLSPQQSWADLSERLLYETSVADGTSWMTRAEAFNRLIAHPAGQHAAISTVAEAAADRSVQSMVGTVSVFETSVHSAASLHVIRHLTNPTTDRSFYGALLASVRKLRYGHFSAAQVHKLTLVIADLISEGRGGDRLSLAALLMKMLPVTMRQKIGHRLWTSAMRGLEQTTVSSYLVDRVCDATAAELDGTSGFADTVLPHLVEELLFDPNFDVRLYAAFLLYATPYRRPLAHALSRELRIARNRADSRWAVTLLEALRILGGADERRHIEQLVLAPHVPGPARDTAASALGHVGGTSSDDYWRSALRVARQRWRQTRATAEVSVLDRLVYALGMADQRALLRRVACDPTMPSRIRSAAHWWVALPRNIYDSARL